LGGREKFGLEEKRGSGIGCGQATAIMAVGDNAASKGKPGK
jgi:hypothetical protein